MRKKFIAGNWKMNLDNAGAVTLATGLAEQLSAAAGMGAQVDVAVCPPFVYVPAVVAAVKNSAIRVGAQDVYFESNGAYTGEISVAMLKDIGCQFVIVGHSERRHVLGESDGLINKKLRAALAGGLEVVFCIGELLEEREQGATEAVLERQLRQGLAEVTAAEMGRITVAYEPVWAIGTGRTATPDQAQEAHLFTRTVLGQLFGHSVADRTRIQYGGSVKPENAAELMQQKDVDGALVGGASLKLDDFSAIVRGGCGA